MKTKLKNNKGITLIALVITIIVLLILAGVSIAMLTGENGLLTKASESKQATEKAGAKEAVQMEVAGSFTNDGVYSKDLAKANIEKNLKNPQAIVTDNQDGTLNVTYKGYEFFVDMKGKISTFPLELPSTEYTTPFLPEGAIQVPGTNLDNGLTIKDAKGNEWVWIEVPTSIYNNTIYNNNGANKPFSSTDYSNIEAVMHKYTETYRNGKYTDTWYSEEQHGLTESKYYELKNNMLKSVYENGGFYIGKYEVGTDKLRNKAEAALEIPVIKSDAYPYNYVTCSQAQELTTNQLSTGERTSSLMFGVQWDLVLKHIETKGGKTEQQLKMDSHEWGNYRDAAFDIDRGKYSKDYGKDFISVNGKYNKKLYSEAKNDVLLTTGATERNSTLNIYDLAGNVFEWTLENTSDNIYPCANRGGGYDNNGFSNPSSIRNYGNMTMSNFNFGFRPALY